MKNLKTLAYQVKPTIPESNSLAIVNDQIYYYDENNKEYSLKSEDIDTSDFATKEELVNYSLINHTHTYVSITGKPSTFAPTIGTTATTAKAGNYTPTATEVVTALKAMTPTQIDEIKTLLGITTV